MGQRSRLAAVDNLKVLLVARVIGGHALLGYSAVGGWPYDEVNEVTFDPHVEAVLAAVLGPSGLFLMGTFYLLSGLFTPESLTRKGTRRFIRDRLVRLGVPVRALGDAGLAAVAVGGLPRRRARRHAVVGVHAP